MTVAKEIAHVTLEEFETMAKDERFNYELIDGVVMMSPSPSWEHQRIEVNLIYKIGSALDKTNYQVIHEYEVTFAGNIFKPDVMVFCKQNDKLPEIIIEILSPSTRQRDLFVKLVKYQAMNIKEYWIIDPKVKTVTIHDFVNHTSESYGINDAIQSKAIPEVIIAVTDIFG